MDQEEVLYRAIVGKMTQEFPEVNEGKMMSAPGIRFKTKVFAFYYEHSMTFRLGKGVDLKPMGITEWKHLSPFKNKPAMTGWYIIDDSYSEHWEKLAYQALGTMV